MSESSEAAPVPRPQRPAAGGRLRIGDDWNAITIIALSQDNPLKAVAELVENSIDAGARRITITRGRERGEHYLEVTDDGRGVPRDAEGRPDFRYVATHICDSLKRRLKAEGARGIQGEYGIGLLSFWTVGEELAMSSGGADGHVYEMRMRKHDPGYSVARLRALLAEPGTRVKIRPLLPGVRQLSGEKIQRYLASELRERIRQSGAAVRVLDRQARKELPVEPRQFAGELLHHLPAPGPAPGEIYVELYLAAPDAANEVGLYRSGTRILASIAELEAFSRPPWTEGSLQGMIDAPFLNLTPATRTGVIHDGALEALASALVPVEARLLELIEERRRAEEERSSRDTLRAIQRAFREALLTLPAEDYDWFEVSARRRAAAGNGEEPPAGDEAAGGIEISGEPQPAQRQFFEFAGPLHSVRIAPAACTVAVGGERRLRALARDASRRHVSEGIEYAWRIVEGGGALDNPAAEYVAYRAPEEPALVRIAVTARQGETACEAEALVTVTDSLLPESRSREAAGHGLPGYTLEHAPGKLWRSRLDAETNVIVVNSGHRDYVFASRAKTLKLRYLVRLYAKEMVRRNFPGLRGEELLDRLIELSLYTEEHLR
ncbi:MAG: ATP-binding protein [Betaproteobacteria bacterium]|nr:ATP-binding protein [Betaproteobacteria bacterium]